MSVDSKLFVVVEKEKVLEVGNEVINQLNSWVRERLDGYWRNNTSAMSRVHFLHNDAYKKEAENYTNGCKIYSYNLNNLIIKFGCGDPYHRRLYTLPKDFGDYNNVVEGNKLVFSISNSGSSEEIMKVVANSCAKFGDVWYDHNDCDDKDFVKIRGKL